MSASSLPGRTEELAMTTVDGLITGRELGAAGQPVFASVEDERLHRKQELAAAFRVFGRFGFSEGVAGHITARDPEHEDRFWVNPFGMAFSQIKVSDLILVDRGGEVVQGDRTVNRAAFCIHSEVHKARPDAVAAANANSLHGKAFSSLGIRLDPLTQDACAFFEDHGLYDDYRGVAYDVEEGRRIGAALGGAKACILRNHGLLTVGESVGEAAWWFVTMERSCQAQLLAAAAGRLTPEALGYIAGSAGSGDTARENLAAFRRWRIVPRMLTNVAAPSYASTVLGAELTAPFLLGPVGVLCIAHPDGEIAVARAATAQGVPMVLSTASSTPMEEVAEANADGQRWYQLYWPNDRAVAASFLARAKAAGFSTLVITLDTRMLAWRPRDLDRAYLPFLRGIGVQNYLTDPAFQALLAGPGSADPAEAILQYIRIFGDPSLTWDDLSFARDHWDGPIVLKGILSVADAERAAAAGMDGIIVSNHGGRQVDGAIAALDALPGIAAAVGSRLTVLFDSGIRGGSDMLRRWPSA